MMFRRLLNESLSQPSLQLTTLPLLDQFVPRSLGGLCTRHSVGVRYEGRKMIKITSREGPSLFPSYNVISVNIS